MPWRRKWQPGPVFLPGKSHGQSSLMAYSLWSRVRRDLASKQQQLFVNAYLCLRTGGCGPALGPSLSQLTIPSHPVEGGSCSCSPATFGIQFRSVGLFHLSPLSPALLMWRTSLWGNAESRHSVAEAAPHVLSALLLNCFSVKTALLWKELTFLSFFTWCVLLETQDETSQQGNTVLMPHTY